MTAVFATAEQGYPKAVCYNCNFRTLEPTFSSNCPKCGFPLILQPQNQSMRLNVREIFDRTAVGVGPRLPGMGTQSGVDARYPAHTPPHVLPAASMAPMMPPGAFVTPPPKRRHKLVGLTLALVSAVAIGVVAALIQNAL